MDMQTPDFETSESATTEETPLSRIFIKRLLRKLASALPVDAEQDAEGFAEEWEAARELFDAMLPRNPVEAVLAARAVACHYRNMDMLARAAKPGGSPTRRRCAEARPQDRATIRIDGSTAGGACLRPACRALPAA